MEKDIRRVGSQVTVSYEMLNSCGKEAIEKRVKYDLAHQIANFLLKNLEELPCEFYKEPYKDGMAYKLILNLADPQRINELLRIEREHKYQVVGSYTPFLEENKFYID